MSDWRPKLIVSDLDGTLLRSDETISDATLVELRAWEDTGVPLVIATGRPPRWMLGVRDRLGGGIAVCCNGAGVMGLGSVEGLDEDPPTPHGLQADPGGVRGRHPGARVR